MLAYPPLCDFCTRLKSYKLEEYDKIIGTCEAYPKGIPEAVFYAGHIYPKPGDNGKQFKSEDGKVPEFHQQSQKEEDTNYKEYAEYYEELDMTDEEFQAKMKREHGQNWMFYRKPRRETEPKIW